MEQLLMILLLGCALGAILPIAALVLINGCSYLFFHFASEKNKALRFIQISVGGPIIGVLIGGLISLLYKVKLDAELFYSSCIGGMLFVYSCPRFITFFEAFIIKNRMNNAAKRAGLLGEFMQHPSYKEFNNTSQLPSTKEEMKLDGLTLIINGLITKDQKSISKGKLILQTLVDFQSELSEFGLEGIDSMPDAVKAQAKTFSQKPFEENKDELKGAAILMSEHFNKYGDLLKKLKVKSSEELETVSIIFKYLGIFD